MGSPWADELKDDIVHRVVNAVVNEPWLREQKPMKHVELNKFLNAQGGFLHPVFDTVSERNYQWLIPLFKKSVTYYEFKYWQTIKIRNTLSRVFKTQGYPVWFESGVDFTSGLGLHLPVYFRVNTWRTFDGWRLDYKNDPLNLKRVWRICRVDFQDVYGDPVGVNVPFIDNIIDGWRMTVRSSTDPQNPYIAPNLAFYNTINDLFIMANWDFFYVLLQKLEELGYLE